jgi:monothiol glutaredoxin
VRIFQTLLILSCRRYVVAVKGTGVSPELKTAIELFINENKVVVFMKGTKQMPLCGFSNTVVQILNTMSAPFVAVNILEDDLLRTGEYHRGRLRVYSGSFVYLIVFYAVFAFCTFVTAVQGLLTVGIAGMKDYSSCPTFPQVYIDGEFFGGCDIMIASYQSGELQEVLEAALNS